MFRYNDIESMVFLVQIWNILFLKILTIYFFGNPIFAKSNPPQKNKPTTATSSPIFSPKIFHETLAQKSRYLNTLNKNSVLWHQRNFNSQKIKSEFFNHSTTGNHFSEKDQCFLIPKHKLSIFINSNIYLIYLILTI